MIELSPDERTLWNYLRERAAHGSASNRALSCLTYSELGRNVDPTATGVTR